MLRMQQSFPFAYTEITVSTLPRAHPSDIRGTKRQNKPIHPIVLICLAALRSSTAIRHDALDTAQQVGGETTLINAPISACGNDGWQ